MSIDEDLYRKNWMALLVEDSKVNKLIKRPSPNAPVMNKPVEKIAKTQKPREPRIKTLFLINEMLLEGFTCQDIARATKRTRQAVSGIKNRHGLPMEPDVLLKRQGKW